MRNPEIAENNTILVYLDIILPSSLRYILINIIFNMWNKIIFECMYINFIEQKMLRYHVNALQLSNMRIYNVTNKIYYILNV